MEIERRALSELTARCGQDARLLSNELDKLICASGGQGEIRVEDVKAMVAPTAELSVFDLVDAVAERKPREAVSQLEALLDQQAQPFMILAMLSRQLRLLIQARYLLDAGLLGQRELRMRPYDFGQLLGRASDERSLLARLRQEAAGILPNEGKASILNQHYYPFWKSLQVAQRLEAATLAAGLARLLQTDLALKSSHLEPRQELELLVIDLCIRMEAGATVDYDKLLEV
jgi:DNA polymerase-3 subunit delta